MRDNKMSIWNKMSVMFGMIDGSKDWQITVETHSERRLSNHRMINATHVNTRLAISPHDKVDTPYRYPHHRKFQLSKNV